MPHNKHHTEHKKGEEEESSSTTSATTTTTTATATATATKDWHPRTTTNNSYLLIFWNWDVAVEICATHYHWNQPIMWGILNCLEQTLIYCP
jgi:hypothetical protein